MLERRVTAYAKINLTLDVVGRRDDGYHEMLMVMQSISLGDDVVVKLSEGSGKITVSTDRVYIPDDERNIAYKAAAEFLRSEGIKNKNVDINITKKIPVCAGMGGGSSDAAAVLRALNILLERGMDESRLKKLAEKIGSDVPFCVSGGTCIARGRGEELTRLKDMPDCFIAICKPSFSVSTPKLFAELDKHRIKARPDTEGMLEAIERGELPKISRRCWNIFEEVLPPRAKAKIERAKSVMLSCGAYGACMTGTGSAVFGIFKDEAGAAEAKNALSPEFEECFTAKNVKSF